MAEKRIEWAIGVSLTPEQYNIAKAIFHKALALDKLQRKDFLARECQGQRKIQVEVETLLRIHEGTPSESLPPYMPIKIAFESPGNGPLPRFGRFLLNHPLPRFLVIGGILLLILSLAKMGRETLRHSLEVEIKGHLESVLNSNFLAVDLWSAHRFEEIERMSEVLNRGSGLKELLRIARSEMKPGEALRAARAQRDIRRILANDLKQGPFDHFIIFNEHYQNVSTDLPSHLGVKATPDTALMLIYDRIFKGEKLLLPRRLLGSAAGDRELMKLGQYFSWFVVPLHDESGQVIAGFAAGIEASANFDRILKVGRWGASGETYAFDTQGQMLSESRFSQQLDFLRAGPSSGSKVMLKDPGGDLTRGYQAEGRIGDKPLTQIVTTAIGKLQDEDQPLDGNILKPYRDYRGIEVIGAWRWHPSLSFGLITEVDADEVLATLRFVDLLYMGLVFLFLCVAAIATISSFAWIRMRPAAHLGARMGQYKLLRKIAEGGIGEIYLAKHEFLKRPTAVKLLKPDINDPESLTRFESEVRATSRLSHPNTVTIYDFGRTADRRFYYAMEFLPGISLSKLIEIEEQLPSHRTIHLLHQISASLREAHSLGLIHRDIKPLNIMICLVGGEFDVVKVVDFGLVKSIKSLVPSASLEALPDSLRGTPAYIAPELLINPLAANVSSDIYSLGVVAYKILSGQNLFDGAIEAGLFYDILHTDPKELSQLRPDIPPALADLVMRCVHKDPRARPGSMEEFSLALAAIPQTQPWSQEEARKWWGLRDHLLMLSE